MKKYIKHLITVLKHKWVVFNECRKCGILWQGITHDLSKFSPVEFFPSGRYFQGSRSPIEAEKETVGYSAAWLHHKGHNPHHWEYWIDYGPEGEILPAKIPYKYVLEMICDYIGAGKVYNGGAWTQEEPLKYFQKVRDGRYFHPETERLIILLLRHIADNGLQSFYRLVKGSKGVYNYD